MKSVGTYTTQLCQNRMLKAHLMGNPSLMLQYAYALKNSVNFEAMQGLYYLSSDW